MSQYIQSAEYATYGLPVGSDTDKAVKSASALIDAHLERPEGLVWTPDVEGQPCFMAGATALRSWKIQADIMPGTNVTVNLDSAPPASVLGEALVLDSPTPLYCETVVVNAIDGVAVTFTSVLRNHSATSPISTGLVINEKRLVGYQCPVAFLSRSPIASVIAVGSRWDASSRREPSLSDRQHDYLGGFATGIGPVPSVGRAPQWSMMDPAMVDCDSNTGKLLVHAVSARSEVRVSYLAGWDQESLPEIIKQVCARMSSAILTTDPDIPFNAKLYRAGDTAIQRFAASFMDDDMRMQLRGFGLNKGL